MEKIIECIPNFSEGRDLNVINQIVDAIQSVPGTKVLHKTSDFDHNRSVITFIGPPDAVIKGAFQAIKKAAELIDLNHHKGVHPRIGATDVMPFVPLKNVTEEECIAYAKELGERVGKDLKIPVYLYEKAALKPERRNLADIRNREHEKEPDFGPNTKGTAGSTVIGVRDILVAFNVNLKTTNLKIAKEIAKTVRESSGGLKAVKALGLELSQKGLTQVSMNLIDYKTTSPKQVFDKIQKEANKHNVEILESEIIGMIPKDALFEGAKEYLKLTNFTPTQILTY